MINMLRKLFLRRPKMYCVCCHTDITNYGMVWHSSAGKCCCYRCVQMVESL